MARQAAAADSRQFAGNHLLGVLSANALAPLRPHFELVDLPLRAVISKAGTPIRFAHFLIDGMISLVHPLSDGSVTEVGIIGREGFHGVPLLLRAQSATTTAIVQTKGRALRISAASFLEVTRA